MVAKPPVACTSLKAFLTRSSLMSSNIDVHGKDLVKVAIRRASVLIIIECTIF